MVLVEVVDGVDVVEIIVGDVVVVWGVGVGYDLWWLEGDGVYFVCCVGVLDDEFVVLWSRNEVFLVGWLVYCIDFCEMVF